VLSQREDWGSQALRVQPLHRLAPGIRGGGRMVEHPTERALRRGGIPLRPGDPAQVLLARQETRRA